MKINPERIRETKEVLSSKVTMKNLLNAISRMEKGDFLTKDEIEAQLNTEYYTK